MQIEHLLSKHNILSNFTITKNFSNSQFESYKNVLKKKYKSKKKIDEKLNQYIASKFNANSTIDRIPGNITSYKKQIQKQSNSQDETDFVKDFKSLPLEHRNVILNTSKQIINLYNQNDLSPLSLFFMLQIIFNGLNINDETMKKISNKYKNPDINKEDENENE
jgi:ribosomal protein S17E